jgi:transposase
MNPEELQAEARQLEERLQQLEAERRQLEDFNRSLRAQEQMYLELLATRDATIAELTAKAQEQAALIAQLQRMLFGPTSERMTEEQAAELEQVQGDLGEQQSRPAPDSDNVLAQENDSDAGQEAQSDPKDKPRRSHKVRDIPTHLEVQTAVLEPTEPPCEHCGKMGAEVSREVSEVIELVPAKLIVRRTVRIKRRCQCGGGGIAIAPLPTQLLPGSKLGVGLAVHILLSKYDDHIALYTLERIFRERHNVIIPRQQMVQWIEHIAGLLRLLVDRILQRIIEGSYLQIDETPVRVLDPEVKGKAAKGYLWFIAVPDGDVVLIFDLSRSHEVPKKALAGFRGVFQSDDFSAYETLVKKLPDVRRAGCAAHARRKFYEAALQGDRQAIWFIAKFRQLYRIEDDIRPLSPAERQTLRSQQAPGLWAEMKERADHLQPIVLPQSSLGRAIAYFRGQYDALRVYLERPDYQIDNNLVENSIRPSCIGKRRWLFIGHPQAGWRSAVIYSIIQSCRRRKIDPQVYLTDVLRRLPGMKNTEIDCLLPECWKPTTLNSS